MDAGGALLERRVRRLAKQTQIAVSNLRLKNPESLHDARVALRRLESVLHELGWIFIDLNEVHEITSRLRKLSNRLQQFRDLTVVSDILNEFQKTESTQTMDQLVTIGLRLGTTQDREHAKVRRLVRTRDHLRAIKVIRKRVSKLKVVQGRAEQIDLALEDYLESSENILRRALSNIDYQAETGRNLHKLRVRVKRARYVAEFVRTSRVANDDTFFGRQQVALEYSPIQGQLGRIHDLMVFDAWLERKAGKRTSLRAAFRLLNGRSARAQQLARQALAQMPW